MNEAGTIGSQSDGPDQAARAVKRFNVLVVFFALGTLGILLLRAYRTFANIEKDAGEIGGVFGLLAPPSRKSLLSRIAGKG